MNYIIFFVLIFSQWIGLSFAHAWGGRGHQAICETATQLVKNKNLKEYLTFRPQMLGYICNLPDINWKKEDGVRSLESPTHWIDPEVVGLKIKDVPLDYQQIIATYTGKPNLFWPEEPVTSVPAKFGSLWWRADQFVRLGKGLKPRFENIVLPKNTKEARDEKLPYNQAVYDMTIYMGLLGHYVGDASMPYHSTADHDGWKAGHGGIHFYYEDAIVSQFPPDLQDQIFKAAQKMRKEKNLKFMKGRPIERMKGLSEVSVAEVERITRFDPVIKKSATEKPKEIEEWNTAQRKSPEIGYKIFKKQIINDLARSSLLLAAFWDEIYEEIGKPDLSKYRNYRYPFTLEHVVPDYQGSQKSK